MKIFKKTMLLLVVTAMTGCVQYTLVKAGPVKVGKISFKTDEAWNKSPSKIGKKTTIWTADGMLLNKVIFVDGIVAGEKMLTEPSKGTPLPKFNPNLLPHEIEDFIRSSLVNNSAGSLSIDTSNLKPAKFGDAMGVEFEMSFFNGDGLAYRGKTLSAIKDNKLYAIIYLATKLHYYEKHEAQIDNMFTSATIL